MKGASDDRLHIPCEELDKGKFKNCDDLSISPPWSDHNPLSYLVEYNEAISNLTVIHSALTLLKETSKIIFTGRSTILR